MKTKVRCLSVMVVAALVAASSAWTATSQGVSPGSTDRVDLITSSCPTFSWGAETDVSHFEIVVYLLEEHLQVDNLLAADLGEWNEVLYTTVPGAAASWTPAAGQSLAPGHRYVWFVRGVKSDADGTSAEAGEWSEGRFFAIPAEPTSQQFHEALQLVQRYLQLQGGGPSEMREGATTFDGHDSASEMVSAANRSVPASAAAIRGALPDDSGESYGVVGISASTDGAGLAAVNTAGGADLVLDGSEDAAADTELSEAGISRTSGFAETFSISNPGSGGITLDVNGDIEVVDVAASGTFTGDGSGLTGISFTEADPVYMGDPAYAITTTNINNWTTAHGWGNHAVAGYDNTDDPWSGSVGAVWTQAQVGIGLTGPPAYDLHIQRNMPPGIPHVFVDQMGPGDAFMGYTLSAMAASFAAGIDAADQTFKLTNSPALTSGVGSAQGDGLTIIRASTDGIVDFSNQSRARASLNHVQGVYYSVWTPIEFEDDSTTPHGYDQRSEFNVWTPMPTPAFFVPLQEGYYQVNARAEFEYSDVVAPWVNGYVSIAIFVNGAPYAEGNNLQMISAGSDVMAGNNAPNVSDVVYLVPGDVVDIRVVQFLDSSSPVWLVLGPNKTYVSIHKSS